MGTVRGAHAPEEKTGWLTPGMRWALVGVAVVVVVGLIWAGSLFGGQPGSAPPVGATPGSTGQSDAPGTPTPAPTPVDGSEVQPLDARQTDASRLPDLPQSTPLVAAPLPADATAAGKLVDGFPAAVAGPLPDATIVDSSVASDGATMQVGLTARTDQSATVVADHYRELWRSLGLIPAGGDGTAISYADRFTSISLTTSDTGTGLVYQIYGTLRTE